jgi:putative endonuclease
MEAEDNGRAKEAWYLYILRCANDTFYTGVTKDLDRRLKMHNAGTASKYTRTRRPVEMVHSEKCGSRAKALVRECKVKALSRPEKEKLVLNIKRKKKGKHHGQPIYKDRKRGDPLPQTC